MADSTNDRENTEAIAVYLRLKALFGGARANRKRPAKTTVDSTSATSPYEPGREPRGLGSVVDSLTAQLGWNSPLAQSELIASWSELTGAETAQHAVPRSVEDGVLTVSCDSTAWATQLRIMRAEILKQIALRYPDAGIESIRFLGPNTPSWKRGPRSIPGRGPRDTYG